MPRDSLDKPSGDQKQFTCPGTSGSAPESADSGVGPGVDVDVLLSRSGVSHGLGKMTAELGRVRMSEETLLALQVKAAEHGMSLSEFVRVVLECSVFGTDRMATIAADRVRRVGQLVGGNGHHEGQR